MRVDWQKMVGQTFDRLTVIALAGRIKKSIMFLCCRCSCGKELIVQGNNVRTGRTRSCGCAAAGLARLRLTKHGMTGTYLYKAWYDMQRRCYCKKSQGYLNYGGRGITVCEEWQQSLLLFCEWAMSHGYTEGLEIDRRDNDGPYSPDNCRFVTRIVNVNNTRLLRQDSTTGFRGVSAHRNVYRAHVGSSLGPKLSKSGFKTAEAAARYRDAHCIKHDIPLPLNFKENDHEL